MATAATSQGYTPSAETGKSGWSIVLGIVLVLASVLVLGAAAFSSALIVSFLGWALLIGGVVQLLSIFFVSTNRLAFALFGILNAVIGLLIISNPGYTLGTLTLLFGMVLTAGGLIRMASALFGANKMWNFFGGLLSFILGVAIWAHWPNSSYYTFGIFLGVYLMIAGVSQIFENNQPKSSYQSPY
jgi:uncharacterized membrane protein HdeD (DUF308 family)